MADVQPIAPKNGYQEMLASNMVDNEELGKAVHGIVIDLQQSCCGSEWIRTYRIDGAIS